LNKPTTVKELCKFIWYLEEKYNLLDFEINGVKPWQAHRIEIYYEIGRKCGVFEKELKREMNKLEKLKSLGNLIKNSILFNPINIKKTDKLIFSHPRSKKVDGILIDIYTDYFIEDLIKNNDSFYEMEEHFNGKHLRKYKNYKKYLDFINLYRNIANRFIKIDLSIDEIKTINLIENEINNILNEKINIKNILINRTKKFISVYSIYKKILTKSIPKEIYVVVSYGRSELIKVAKDLNIKVIELQHGTFSKYHLGYSYPNYKKNLDYFPDEFWVWNEYWKNLIDFPINKENIKIYPFKYLETEKQKHKNIQKKEDQMVVLCQGGLTDRMAKKILDNYKEFSKFNIIFKLHPEEYGRSHLYKNLSTLKQKLNIDIVEDVDLYKLLAESEYQSGVFSTALYEGIEFNCKTILFNLPGIEYMDKFIEIYGVEVI
jgi:hypothetical protein